MYQDSPTTDLPELSQDLVQLEKTVRRIFVSRILSTILTTTIMFGVSVYLALTPTITSNSIPYAFVWILYGIGIITATELILEIIAAYYRPRWYGYVNFFVWNIIGQIGLLTSRQAVSGRQNSLFSSVISLNPKESSKMRTNCTKKKSTQRHRHQCLIKVLLLIATLHLSTSLK